MYEFFGLTCEPFSVAADPRFIYMSPEHRQAMAHLNYGLRRGAGFILLTGEIGAGKTTVCRLFLRRLPASDDVAFVVNPRLDARALLTRLCEDLRIELPVGTVDLIDAIHGHLLLAHAAGRRTLIVVDEAQALSLDVLEQLRLLTNLDTSGGKLQVFLIGQPELRGTLQQAVLEPLAQRVVARFHLAAMPEQETALYIAHRLSVAGLVGPVPFEHEAVRLIHRLCAGVPRRINVLCDRALYVAESLLARIVTQDMVERAALEVFDDRQATVAAPSPAPLPAAAATTPAPLPALESPLPAPTKSVDHERRWPALAAVAAAALIVGSLLGQGHLRRAAPLSADAPAARARVAAAAMPAEPDPPSGATVATTPPPASARPLLPAAAPLEAPPLEKQSAAPQTQPAAPLRFNTIETVFDTAAVDELAAWRTLAPLWGAQLGVSEPCASAARLGLRCYRATGGLASVRQLNRPGFLKLVRGDRRVAYALLVGLTDDSATFRSGEQQQSVPLADLAGRWRGEFATLWRTPAGYRPGESMGAGDALTEWLSQKFSKIDGASSPSTDAKSVAARLSVFQLAHGLEPDGLVGPLTLMQLNRVSGVDEPRLQVER
jgi:general secretion pathway protein A